MVTQLYSTIHLKRVNFTCTLYLKIGSLKITRELISSDYVGLRWVQGTYILISIPLLLSYTGGKNTVHTAKRRPPSMRRPNWQLLLHTPLGKEQRTLDWATGQRADLNSVLSSTSTSKFFMLLCDMPPICNNWRKQTLKVLCINVSPENLRDIVLNST